MSEIQIEFEGFEAGGAGGGESDAGGTTSASGDTERGAESLEVILHLTREQFIAQQTHLSALDAKAGFILGSASLLTGVLAVWQRPEPGDYILLTNLIHEWSASIIQWLPTVAVVIYLLVVIIAFTAYLPFKFEQAPDPNVLNSAFRSSSPQEIRQVALEDTVSAFNENAARLKAKSIRVRVAFAVFLVQAIIVAALLVVGQLH